MTQVISMVGSSPHGGTVRSNERVLLLGYFGRGNLGDDAMLEGLLLFLQLRRPGLETRCMPLPPLNARLLPRVRELVRNLRWADVSILVGGTHFHDGFGFRSVRLLLAHLLLFALAARETTVGLAGVGVGPLRTPLARVIVRLTLCRVRAVLVRDTRSMVTVSGLSSHPVLIQGFDLASLLLLPHDGSQKHLSGSHSTARVLGVSLMPYYETYRHAPADDMVALGGLVSLLGAQVGSLTVVTLPFYTGRAPNDVSLSEAFVGALMRESTEARVVEVSDPRAALSELARVDAVIAWRYHATLLSYLAGKPVLVVGYDEKCVSLAEELQIPRQAILSPADYCHPGVLGKALKELVERPQDCCARTPREDILKLALSGVSQLFDSLLGTEGHR